jgi:hypothetical protein
LQYAGICIWIFSSRIYTLKVTLMFRVYTSTCQVTTKSSASFSPYKSLAIWIAFIIYFFFHDFQVHALFNGPCLSLKARTAYEMVHRKSHELQEREFPQVGRIWTLYIKGSALTPFLSTVWSRKKLHSIIIICSYRSK